MIEAFSVDKEEYQKIVDSPFSVFETVAFAELNRNKVDSVHYLIFKDNRIRFALVAGIKDNVLKMPFSASFAAFSRLNQHIEITHYHQAVEALIDFAKSLNCRSIFFSLPPHFYYPTHLSQTYNALYVHEFIQQEIDVNYEFHLKNFDDNYVDHIEYDAKKSLNKAIRNNLIFELTTDIQTVYRIIEQNREEHGFPMTMSLEEVLRTVNVVEHELFIVRSANNTPIASALTYQLTAQVVRVIYWGNIRDGSAFRPMNFLSYNIFKHFSQKAGINTIDIGHSTEHSVPNFGLCDFKQAIGCDSSPKYTFVKDLSDAR